jgi:predicted RNase H-like HicB family nuclease
MCTRPMDKPLYVHAEWDQEASIWVAESRDVPGLATEATTIEALIEKLEVLIPELLEANGLPTGDSMQFELLARRFDRIRSAA